MQNNNYHSEMKILNILKNLDTLNAYRNKGKYIVIGDSRRKITKDQALHAATTRCFTKNKNNVRHATLPAEYKIFSCTFQMDKECAARQMSKLLMQFLAYNIAPRRSRSLFSSSNFPTARMLARTEFIQLSWTLREGAWIHTNSSGWRKIQIKNSNALIVSRRRNLLQ